MLSFHSVQFFSLTVPCSIKNCCNSLSDHICDHKVKAISALEVSIGQVIDYRKLGTALPLLLRFPMQIDQTATIQAGEQFVRLEYQGSMGLPQF